nr:unnamed protein product [Spirometra erinaceieuropaei]
MRRSPTIITPPSPLYPQGPDAYSPLSADDCPPQDQNIQHSSLKKALSTSITVTSRSSPDLPLPDNVIPIETTYNQNTESNCWPRRHIADLPLTGSRHVGRAQEYLNPTRGWWRALKLITNGGSPEAETSSSSTAHGGGPQSWFDDKDDEIRRPLCRQNDSALATSGPTLSWAVLLRRQSLPQQRAGEAVPPDWLTPQTEEVQESADCGQMKSFIRG